MAARLADLEFCVCCDVQVVYSRPSELTLTLARERMDDLSVHPLQQGMFQAQVLLEGYL